MPQKWRVSQGSLGLFELFWTSSPSFGWRPIGLILHFSALKNLRSHINNEKREEGRSSSSLLASERSKGPAALVGFHWAPRAQVPINSPSEFSPFIGPRYRNMKEEGPSTFTKKFIWAPKEVLSSITTCELSKNLNRE
jgi:hypothetical protein